MGLRTPAEYVASLRDNRTVYFRGQRVPDVTEHPALRIGIDHAAIDFALAEEPEHRDLAVLDGCSRYFKMPESSDDLLKRSALIELSTRKGATMVCLVKEIGTDCLFALTRVAQQTDVKFGTEYAPRVRQMYERCRHGDLAIAVAQSDVKGDRSKGPSQQADPDQYVRIVSRDSKGIVVRGCKVHTSVSVNANELFVIPTRAMTEADADYAAAFAIPVATEGLKLIASPYDTHPKNRFEHPLSAEHKMFETMTVFDDVFVPWERVFLAGEWQMAGPLALGFVDYHRLTAISYKLPLVDLLVGAAFCMAEYNGIEKAGHVRDKLIWLISYAETLRALTRHACMECVQTPEGLVKPHTLTVNMAKHHFAAHYHQALAYVQDITGGLAATAPSLEDFESAELSGYLLKYLAGKAPYSAEERLRMINLVQDLTASDFAGYHAVLAIHAEGSIEAEKLAILREYDPRPAVSYAQSLVSPVPSKGEG
ncbi:MAG TPA: 4-hydroxyphenylacetate 3-hydroxylase N-terminal domain-containing protein [Chloroflexota bacterium]|nr:4-hydroxyphenylacetate 3-hydroxylase N-terminal domain-containing protein [Chloroflexota bacterium]